MDYPKTDDDWEKLAECIVMKDTGVLPEAIGKLTVEATATIFSWYRMEERSEALGQRQLARADLIEHGIRAGCLEEREEIIMSGEMIEVPLERPVPQTYGDWVTLGMDIKETAGIDDYKTTAEVNIHLEHIYKEEETDPGTVRESKMWLIRKAAELGIK